MDHEAAAHNTDLMTITRFVLNEQSKYPESRGDFSILLSHIVLGCKFVCSAVNKAGLAKLIGLAGETNVQGEEQKKLDVLSNEVFVKALVSSGRTVRSLNSKALDGGCVHDMGFSLHIEDTSTKFYSFLQSILVSEEDEEATYVESSKRGKYCVVFDPLDGSSNIDCGVSIGTIFGIYMLRDGSEGSLSDVLQPGKNMVAAGYCMYGSSLIDSKPASSDIFLLEQQMGHSNLVVN
eukprot:Gb_39286 [translate_table: standard]